MRMTCPWSRSTRGPYSDFGVADDDVIVGNEEYVGDLTLGAKSSCPNPAYPESSRWGSLRACFGPP